MIRIGTVKQLEELKVDLPQSVKEECLRIVEILDENYGEDRDVEVDLGGFVVLVESKQDFEELKENNLDVLSEVAENVSTIYLENAKYFSVLYLLSSDFAINILTEEKYLEVEVLRK